MVGFIETLDMIHVRRTGQMSVQPVGPCVVGTLNGLEMATRFFAQARPAMPADVIKAVNLAGLIADHDQTFARHLLQKVITGVLNLALVPDAKPVPTKDPILFLFKNVVRNEIRLRQRL